MSPDDDYGPDEDECLEASEFCSGPVVPRSVDGTPGTYFPRCEFHWERRLERRENSMERYADSDVRPAWFDPSIAGERWDEDDPF